MITEPVALVTGASRRVGAVIASRLHQAGYRVLIHYRRSATEAQALADQLNLRRPDSAAPLQADLCVTDQRNRLATDSLNHWGRLDLLINNASDFYPTPLGKTSEGHWEQLLGSNLKAPFFLSQALAPELQRNRGAIINLVDIHAQRPLAGFSVYSIAKAGMAMLTQTLAKELAPHVRVNGVAPGPILPPLGAAQRSPAQEQQALQKTLLGRYGTPEDIAEAVLFLAQQPYITGQILPVDGGKSLYS